jgi:CHRD domain
MAMRIKTSLAVLALGALVATPLGAISPRVTLNAALAGSNEPAGGDADGTGGFSAVVDVDAGQLCYKLTASSIAAATMAHIHSGAAGANGPPVATIELTENQCIAVDSGVLRAIVAAPGNYYINVHNAEFPAGAVRGQLVAG